MSQVLAQYQPTSTGWDELFTGNGSLREQWRHFASLADELGTVEITRRWRQAQRLLNENGIAFGAHGDSDAGARPWEFDALPLLLGRDEWQRLSDGLRQRARVLELTLQDLYGPKRLLEKRLLPPEIIFLHSGYHRELHGVCPSLGRYLHNYAADLGRSPDGSWWLLGDRCEAPSGAGYALENRVICSRMFPEAFRTSNVFRLANYFEVLKESCRESAQRNRENPRIVLLSQGPQHENYFEDAYLARYLGYTLVEAADLVVRERSVWWKTLGGLYRVDVILRRPNSRDCDSLELDTSSTCAVPGLVDAIRAGNVAVSNPLGSGLVESPVFMAYASTLCKELLGEDLILPSIATWWCGDELSRKYVLDNLDALELKRAFRQRGAERAATQELKTLSRPELVERIQNFPQHYVAQEKFTRSAMPNWGPEQLSRAHVALRSFLFIRDDDYVVLPGGLARTADTVASLDLSLAAGEGSKDTWVQGADKSPHISGMHGPSERITLRRSGDDLPSRVADDVYWTGRHIQRADFAARLLRTLTDRIGSAETDDTCSVVPIILRTMADQGQIEPGFVLDGMRDQLPAIEETLPAAVFDANQPNSLSSILESSYTTAARIRDRLSTDAWRVMSRIRETFRRPADQNFDTTDLLNLSSELIVNLASFGGLIAESMTRTQAFHFMDLGIRVERAAQTAVLVANAFQSEPISNEALDALLRICDSRMTYRYRYLSTLASVPVLDLLLTDETNPRSIVYQLNSIGEHFKKLPRNEASALTTNEERILMSMLYQTKMFDVTALGGDLTTEDRDKLLVLCQVIDDLMPQLSQAITNKYLVHAGPTRLLTSMEINTQDAD